MNAISGVSDDAYAKVQLLAQAWNISSGEAVARLVEHFARTPTPHSTAEVGQDGRVPIHIVYNGTRVDAYFDPATEAVEIDNGKLKGRTYSSPSGAAGAVVASINPSVKPNRNGWIFWLLTETGELLQTIRRRSTPAKGVAP